MSGHGPQRRALLRLSRIAAVWALLYGVYRLYYAAGGAAGMLGTPRSHDQWIRINAVAGVLLLVFAVLPVALVNAWSNARARPVLLALCWIVTVACVSHAAIGIVQRIASLTGTLTIDYPFWQTIDRREADLQALFFNEPWFLVQGLLWAAIAWHGSLWSSPRRRRWLGSAAAATLVATATGIATAYGVIERTIIG
ncbi:MAG TPA: DUF3995 domain-containing protein [Longimicrobiales bacterium]|nr:DUF3995 domain-containing protein [Longimicrobiales bacterium]